MPEYDYGALDLDAITYSDQGLGQIDSNIDNDHRLLRGRGGGGRSSSSRSSSSRSSSRSRSSYSRTTYRRTSKYYSNYSSYIRSPMRMYYVYMYHPVAYWNVYSNRGGWGSGCTSDQHCRSNCCNNNALGTFTYTSPAGAISGQFTCLNSPADCGYGGAGGGGGIISAIVGLFFLCFCCIAGWFVCKSCSDGEHHDSSEHGSEHYVEEVIVEEKIVEEIHHGDGGGYPGPPAYGQQPVYGQQPGGYPPQQPGGYPPQQPGGYPPQQPGGYPQQQPGYAPPQGGYGQPGMAPPGMAPPMQQPGMPPMQPVYGQPGMPQMQPGAPYQQPPPYQQ